MQVQVRMTMIKKLQLLSGADLKHIAIVTMVIDHFAAVVLAAYLRKTTHMSVNSNELYTALRTIGRIAFPIYCFLIAEGAVHTRNKLRYALRLLACAVISIVPFSLALHDKVFTWTGHNVFFSLFFGLMSIYAFEEVDKRFAEHKGLGWFLAVLAFFALTAIGVIIQCDYRSMGPVLMVSFYLGRKSKIATVLFGSIGFLVGTFSQYFFSYFSRRGYYKLIFQDVITKGIPLEIWGILAILVILLYNGKRGKQLRKSFYYLFYPVHLALFAAIKMIWFK